MKIRRKFAWKRMLSLVLALLLAIPAVQMSGNDRITVEAATSVSLSVASEEIVAKKNEEGKIEDVVFGNQDFTIGTPTEDLTLVIWYQYAFDKEVLETIKKSDGGEISGRLAEINVSNKTNYVFPCLYAGEYIAALYLNGEKVSEEVTWTVKSEIEGYTRACTAREYMIRELQSFPAEIDVSSFSVPEEWVGVIGEAISSRGTTYMVPYYGLEYTWAEVQEDAYNEDGSQKLDDSGNPVKVTKKYLQSIIPTYWITEQQYEVMETYVDNALDVLIPENATDEQKIVGVYFFETLISNSKYTDKVSDCVNPFSTLMEKGSVCDGYARTLEYLCYKVGLNCVKGGNGSDNGGISHAWCAVAKEGSWYQFDPTWDNYNETVNWMFQTDQYFMKNHSQIGAINWSQGGFLLPKCEDPYYTNPETGEYGEYVILGSSRGVILPYEYTNPQGTEMSGYCWSDGNDILFSPALYYSAEQTVLQEGSNDVLAYYFNAAGKQPEVFVWSDIPSKVLPGDTLRIAGGAVGYMKDFSNPNDKTGMDGSYQVIVTTTDEDTHIATEVARYNVKALEILEFTAPEEVGTYSIRLECNNVFCSDEIGIEVVEEHETKTISLGNGSDNNYSIEIGKDYYILNGFTKEYVDFIGNYNIVQTEDLVYQDIVVKDGFSNKITINGVRLDGVFDASAAGSMELVLKGDNSFVSDKNGIAAMTVSKDGDFVISGDGNLSVINEDNTDMPAICMSSEPDASLTIGGGIITAQGGAWSAAIGPKQDVKGSQLIVAAGTIYATPGYGIKHALGGSLRGQCSKIYIFGGNIIAQGNYLDNTPNIPIGYNVNNANKVDTAYTDRRVKTKMFVFDGGEANANKWVQSVDFGDYLYNTYATKADATGKVYIYAPSTVKQANIKVTFGDTMCTKEPDIRVKRGDESPIWLYGNGGRNKTTLFTKLVAGTYTNASGKTAKGKIVWLATPDGIFDYDEVQHKVSTKSDTSVVAVSSSGVVTAKAEGTMCVLAIDTATFKTEKFEVTVKAAPAAVSLYRTMEETPANGDVIFASTVVPYGEEVTFFVKGYTGKLSKTSNTVKVITDKEITYSVTVPAKQQDYVRVRDNGNNSFTVTVDEELKTLSKNGKPVAVSLSIVCDKSGKKATFKINASNPVKTMTFAAADEDTDAVVDEETGLFTVTMDSAKGIQQTGIIKETTTLWNDEEAGNDATKIVKLPCANGYKFDKNGGVVADGKTTADQNKVSIAYDKKNDVYKVTAKKGTQPGTVAYFAIVHNTYNPEPGNGFEIVKVVVGEANHYTTINVAPLAEEVPENISWQDYAQLRSDNRALVLPSATLAEQKFQIKETLNLAFPAEEATDYNKVYPLPSEDGYYWSNAGDLIVDGALSKNQKKIKMTLDKGTKDTYTIKAPKGTPEGTTAYFMLYHNMDCFSVISVTVGVPNEVKNVELEYAVTTDYENYIAEYAVQTTENVEGVGEVYVLEIPQCKKATKVTFTESLTLQNSANSKTDVSVAYRMPAADAFEPVNNRTTCTITGTLTAAQKKLNIKADSKAADNVKYTVSIAANTPVGTETYFLLYHNPSNETTTGYKVIKVKISDAPPAE